MAGETTPPGASTALLSHEQFARLLERAAERQATESSRPFSLAELVEAGAELGIERRVIEEVYRDHEVDLARPRGRERPFNSKLEYYESGETMHIVVPATRASKVVAGVVTGVSAAIVAGTVTVVPAPGLVLAVVTFIAAGGSFFAIRRARTWFELRLHRNGSGLLSRVVGKGGKGVPLRAGQVHVRHAEWILEGTTSTRRVPYVALDHGIHTYALLEDYSFPERVWAVETIRRWLGQ